MNIKIKKQDRQIKKVIKTTVETCLAKSKLACFWKNRIYA